MQLLGAQEFKRFHLEASRRKDMGLVRSAMDGFGVLKSTIDNVERLNDRTLGFTISTGAVDRDMDCIDQKGWKLDHYQKNPVVLWSHRADEPPIGKAIDLGCDGIRLRSAVQFLPSMGYGSASDLAETIYQLAKDGFLSATSVGFRPLSFDFSLEPERGADGWFPGIDFHEQELVELSIVTVPSNPEALIDNAIPVEPGGGSQDVAPVLTPAPAQLIAYEAARRKRRAMAALVGVF